MFVAGCPSGIGANDAGTLEDGGPMDDAGDAGSLADGGADAGEDDGGAPDAGGEDAGPEDAGTEDAGNGDAGTEDAGALDAGPVDGGCGLEGPSVSCTGCAGATGTIVDLGAFQSPSAPMAPLQRTDGPRLLLFSDSPETPTTSGVLLRAHVPAGPARIVLYHVNGTAAGKKASVVLENEGTTTLTAHLERFAVPPPSTAYVEQGRAAVRAFLGAANAADKSVPPQDAALLLVQSLDGVPVAPGELIHAIIDVSFSAATVVHVVFVDATTDTLAVWRDLPALDRDVHDRGTFDGAERTLDPAGCVWPSGAQRVRFGADTPLLPNPRGLDELTGAQEQLAGHYGSLVRLTVPPGPVDRALVLVPRAGAFAGAVRMTVDDALPVVVDAPTGGAVTAPTSGALLGRLPAGSSATLELMPPGGSNLPVDVVVMPLP